ncbi:hypothetical protein HPC49_50350 [Pyxidicoccus fallax]|uniref:Fibronectin type-III domain-containing protein n=1 Tax=Pyxidicoccus fallax TaxID=394095 RepID=A0A848LUJ6_9BACT|nr:Ig-like domain-containing protein [Pyxidicoccus fallax]NMO21153.1 hypothetical protein [Pyxidicoccus fallax]NPC86377.1 hypothetical protein [Pyxidicoccus fallax]
MSWSHAAWLRPFVRVLVTLTLLSCQSSSVEERAAPSPVPEAGAPFDVSAVMRQVHFAYRPEGTGWRGGHSTYDVSASRDGLTLTPYRHADGSSPARPEVVEGAPLTLGAVRMSRGARQMRASAEARVQVEEGGHLSVSREGFSEHLRNAEDGVRQEWRVEAAPGGAGDLTLSLPVKGMAFVEASEQGLHFREAKSGLGFRYGHADWVEASGRRTPIRARYQAGAIQLQVPEAVLVATVFPATLAPTISPEIGTNQPVPEPASFTQEAPSVASNGTNHLVVWTDYRPTSTFGIYGARVSKAGEVLDDWGIRISPEAQFADDAAVASNGTDYFVAWSSSPSGSTASAIYGARVSGAGELQDASPLLVGTLSTGGQHWPAVASNGTDYLVAWLGHQGGDSGIFGQRVSSAGTVMESADIAISTANGLQTAPALASNGTDYLVAWEDDRNNNKDIFGARVTGAGVVLDGSGIAISVGAQDEVAPSVASNGTDYLVVWEDARNDTAGDIFGARVTGAGAVLDGSGLAISTAAQAQVTPSVASNGTDFFVVWEDARGGDPDVIGARVTSAGSVVDAEGVVIARAVHDQGHPSVTFNGTDFFVAWDSLWNRNVLGARVTSAGVVLDSPGVALATAANEQSIPAVASNGTDYLIVWWEGRHREGTTRIYGVRVSGAGEVLDPLGIVLSPSPGAHLYPAVASNGTDYFVAWEEVGGSDFRILGTRLTSTGEVLDAQGLLLSAPSGSVSSEPAVASNGTDYLVVWKGPTVDTLASIAGTRVTAAGRVLDSPGLNISGAPGSVDDPAVASNGTDYLVVWEDYRNNNNDVFGARVTSAGAVLEAAGIPISTANDNQRDPAVASDGTNYLVVWGDFRRSSASDVYGARVSSEGTVLDASGFAISTANRYQHVPAVASLGTEYLVVWEDQRAGVDIHGARVTSGGTVRESTGFPIANTPDGEQTPAVVFAGAGRTAFVAYVRDDSTAPYWGRRIRGRFVEFTDNRPPVAASRAVSTLEDTPLDILLQGTDPDGQGLTYVLEAAPQFGRLEGTGARRTYSPAANFSGADRITFRVSDGEFTSAVARVSIQVTAVNDAPSIPVLVSPVEGARLESGLVTFRWNASTDTDGESVTYGVEVRQGGEVLRTHDTAATTWTLAAGEVLPVGSYSWRVRAMDERDVASTWSTERAFTVGDIQTGPDGGSPDAGAPDGGEADGGVPDAGAGDGGVPDAGSPPPSGPDSSGCGCNPLPGAGPSGPLTLAALGLLLRWSRRRRG